MIRYSERALKAFAFLFRPFNDIDVYVEDAASRNMYETLVNRILDGQATVTRVFQLGGKAAVIQACNADQMNDQRSRIYIVDGDYDFLLGLEHPNMKHLYRLDVYCSENLVLSIEALLEIAYDCNPNDAKDSLHGSLDIEGFFEDLSQKLIPLLLIYLAVYRLDDSIETMAFNVTELIEEKNNSLELSEANISKRIRELRAKLEAEFDHEQISQELGQANRLLDENGRGLVRQISGKTYLMPLAYHFLRRRASYRGSMRELVVRLSRYCELDIDPGLMAAIEQASQGEYYHYAA